MITVKIVTSGARSKSVIVNPNDTVKNVLDSNDVDYSSAIVRLDMMPVTASEMNKTFAELGVNEMCTLAAIIKADGACR